MPPTREQFVAAAKKLAAEQPNLSRDEFKSRLQSLFAQLDTPGQVHDDVVLPNGPHEPDTYAGGFVKGLADYFTENPLLQSVAHPKTVGDMGNLLIPNTLGASMSAPTQAAGRALARGGETIIKSVPVLRDTIPGGRFVEKALAWLGKEPAKLPPGTNLVKGRPLSDMLTDILTEAKNTPLATDAPEAVSMAEQAITTGGRPAQTATEHAATVRAAQTAPAQSRTFPRMPAPGAEPRLVKPTGPQTLEDQLSQLLVEDKLPEPVGTTAPARTVTEAGTPSVTAEEYARATEAAKTATPYRRPPTAEQLANAPRLVKAEGPSSLEDTLSQLLTEAPDEVSKVSTQPPQTQTALGSPSVTQEAHDAVVKSAVEAPTRSRSYKVDPKDQWIIDEANKGYTKPDYTPKEPALGSVHEPSPAAEEFHSGAEPGSADAQTAASLHRYLAEIEQIHKRNLLNPKAQWLLPLPLLLEGLPRQSSSNQ